MKSIQLMFCMPFHEGGGGCPSAALYALGTLRTGLLDMVVKRKNAADFHTQNTWSFQSIQESGHETDTYQGLEF